MNGAAIPSAGSYAPAVAFNGSTSDNFTANFGASVHWDGAKRLYLWLAPINALRAIRRTNLRSADRRLRSRQA